MTLRVFSVKRYKKPRERAKRATSPYSTDSNYSSAAYMPPQHKPYPKSERRRQLADSAAAAAASSPAARSNSRASSHSATPTSQDGSFSRSGGAGGGKLMPATRPKPSLPQLPANGTCKYSVC